MNEKLFKAMIKVIKDEKLEDTVDYISTNLGIKSKGLSEKVKAITRKRGLRYFLEKVFTVRQLKLIAKELGIKGYSKYNGDQLVSLLSGERVVDNHELSLIHI